MPRKKSNTIETPASVETVELVESVKAESVEAVDTALSFDLRALLRATDYQIAYHEPNENDMIAFDQFLEKQLSPVNPRQYNVDFEIEDVTINPLWSELSIAAMQSPAALAAESSNVLHVLTNSWFLERFKLWFDLLEVSLNGLPDDAELAECHIKNGIVTIQPGVSESLAVYVLLQHMQPLLRFHYTMRPGASVAITENGQISDGNTRWVVTNKLLSLVSDLPFIIDFPAVKVIKHNVLSDLELLAEHVMSGSHSEPLSETAIMTMLHGIVRQPDEDGISLRTWDYNPFQTNSHTPNDLKVWLMSKLEKLFPASQLSTLWMRARKFLYLPDCMIEFIELSTPIMGFTPTVQWNALVSDIDAAILNLFEKIDANSNSNYDNLRDWKNVDKPIWDTFVGVVKKANVYLTPSNGVRTNRDFIRDLLVKTLMAMYDVQLRVETIKIDEDDDDEESDSTDDTKPSIANDLLSGDFAYLLGTTKSLRKLANQLASLKNFKLTSGMAEELALHLVSLNRSQTKITGFINAVHNLAGEDEEVDEEVDEVVDDADL